jgi:hypothetical protein
MTAQPPRPNDLTQVITFGRRAQHISSPTGLSPLAPTGIRCTQTKKFTHEYKIIIPDTAAAPTYPVLPALTECIS